MIEKGQVQFESDLKSKHHTMSEINIRAIRKNTGGRIKDMDDLYVEVFKNKVTTLELLALSKYKTSIIPFLKKRLTNEGSGVICPSKDSVVIELSGCCKPIFGDRIIGVEQKGIVKVHIDTCRNIKNTRSLVDVIWDNERNKGKYDATLKVTAAYKTDYSVDLMSILVESRIGVSDFRVHTNEKSGTMAFEFTIKVSDGIELQRIMTIINNINGTTSVKRVIA